MVGSPSILVVLCVPEPSLHTHCHSAGTKSRLGPFRDQARQTTQSRVRSQGLKVRAMAAKRSFSFDDPPSRSTQSHDLDPELNQAGSLPDFGAVSSSIYAS